MYDEGKVAIVQGVGYDQPSFSHFTSVSFWHTAAPNSGNEYGWLGRTASALDPAGTRANMIVNVSDSQTLAVKGDNHVPLVFIDPTRFQRGVFAQEKAALDALGAPHEPVGDAHKYVLEVTRSAAQASELVRAAWSKYQGKDNPDLRLLDLDKVAALIEADFPTKLYYVPLRNSLFDTHVNQASPHDRQLEYCADAIAGFFQEMQRIGRADEVVMYIHSEFGRRVPENTSLGTDHGHGAAGVIWVIGWCMVLMAGLVRLPVAAVGGFGVAVIALHNALLPPLLLSLPAPLRALLYTAFEDPPIGPLMVLYSIIPWIGVMAAGYAFGVILTLDPPRRDRRCLEIGLGAIALFLVLRGFNLYGDPRPWTAGGPMPALLSFLNTAKYPASLSFLLMTLGPTIALMPLLERARGRLARWIEVFGRVPFFYYVLHIPLIHVLAMLVSLVREGRVNPWLFANHPMGNPPPPDGYTWSLGSLYLVVLVTVLLLYPACRWFADLKARRKEWWLSYL